jgi:hypothetical protein
MSSNIPPLSNIQIQKKVRCKFILYQDMHKIRNINELLPKTIILYQTARVGHWCCVFENSQGINFFDPLGFFIDEMLYRVSYDEATNIHHDYTYLIKLLASQDRPVIYNEYRLQKSGTTTCGYWCTVRLIFSDVENDEFYDCFKNIHDKDKLIVKIFRSF